SFQGPPDPSRILCQMQIAHNRKFPSLSVILTVSGISKRQREKRFFPCTEIRADSPRQNMGCFRRKGPVSLKAKCPLAAGSKRNIGKGSPFRQSPLVIRPVQDSGYAPFRFQHVCAL